MTVPQPCVPMELPGRPATHDAPKRLSTLCGYCHFSSVPSTIHGRLNRLNSHAPRIAYELLPVWPGLNSLYTLGLRMESPAMKWSSKGSTIGTGVGVAPVATGAGVAGGGGGVAGRARPPTR